MSGGPERMLLVQRPALSRSALFAGAIGRGCGNEPSLLKGSHQLDFVYEGHYGHSISPKTLSKNLHGVRNSRRHRADPARGHRLSAGGPGHRGAGDPARWPGPAAGAGPRAEDTGSRGGGGGGWGCERQ